MEPTPSPLHRELSSLALFISLPQIIASPIMVGLSHVMHSGVLFDVKEILDFLVISFPLTLGIALLFVVIERGDFNPFMLVATIAGAALLSNLLHRVIEEIPSVDIQTSFNETFGYNSNSGGNSAAFVFVYKIFGVYWKKFGAILFIQSCCIGIYAGYRYVKIRDSKKDNKKDTKQ